MRNMQVKHPKYVVVKLRKQFSRVHIILKVFRKNQHRNQNCICSRMSTKDFQDISFG
jgi:hypothetical protein